MALGGVTLAYVLLALVIDPDQAGLLVLPIVIGSLLLGVAGGVVYTLFICTLAIILCVGIQHIVPDIRETLVGDFFLLLSGMGAGWLRTQVTAREGEASRQEQVEEAYRILVETSMQGLVIFQDEKVVFANAAEAKLTGYGVEELLAMTPQQTFEMTHPDDRELVARRLQDRAAGKPLPARAEFRLVRKDGVARWVEMYTNVISYQGRPATQIITLDVTERKQMEAALIEAERLRSALGQERELKELKSRFISMVSHQFRTPLSVINTTSYLLENFYDKLGDEKRIEYFGKIRSQIERLDDLIETVLTINQKEENRLEFAPHELDLEAFCRELTGEMQLTSENLHQVIFQATGDLSAAWVDEKLVRHILSNLLSNAIKYSPNGGEVIFKLERARDEAVFQISDSGIGIPADDQKHLFEAFFRGSNVSGIKGSGLGLKIVKDFVELHHGTIDYQSEEGKGTTFTVRLPIVQGEAPVDSQGIGEATLDSGGA